MEGGEINWFGSIPLVSVFDRIRSDRKRRFQHQRSSVLVGHASHNLKNSETWARALNRADRSSADFSRIAKWKNGVGRSARRA